MNLPNLPNLPGVRTEAGECSGAAFGWPVEAPHAVNFLNFRGIRNSRKIASEDGLGVIGVAAILPAIASVTWPTAPDRPVAAAGFSP